MSIEDYAKKTGYEELKYVGDWNGYQVFNPIALKDKKKPLYLGNPIQVLVKDNEIRLSTVLESYQILAYFNSIAQKTK